MWVCQQISEQRMKTCHRKLQRDLFPLWWWRRHKPFTAFDDWQRQREKKGCLDTLRKPLVKSLGLVILSLIGICTFAEPSVPSLWPQPLHRLTKHLIFSYSIISATMILKTDGLLMKNPAHEHFLSQVIIFLEKQTKDRFGSLYFSLRWGIGHKRDNWLPKVTKKVCVRDRNWFHVSWIPNCSFNYPFLSSKWKHLWISDAGEVI